METMLPRKKSATLTERVTLPVDRELKGLIDSLKLTSPYDIPEFIRMILRRELPKLEQGQVTKLSN